MIVVAQRADGAAHQLQSTAPAVPDGAHENRAAATRRFTRVALQKSGPPVPRGDDRARRVVAEEEAQQRVAAQRRPQVEAFVPPTSRGRGGRPPRRKRGWRTRRRGAARRWPCRPIRSTPALRAHSRHRESERARRRSIRSTDPVRPAARRPRRAWPARRCPCSWQRRPRPEAAGRSSARGPGVGGGAPCAILPVVSCAPRQGKSTGVPRRQAAGEVPC